MENFLKQLEQYEPITIQCHNNPDADAIASAFGLYTYFKSKQKNVSIIYGGSAPITKANLVAMIDKLSIPIEYVDNKEYSNAFPIKFDGLLITVDCQYTAGNVAYFKADKIAVIDHHQEEVDEGDYTIIRPDLGSCSTLVWKLLTAAGFQVKDDNLGTALYYGLYTDTGQLAEISNPTDRDAVEALPFKKSLISLFRNSNISMQELDIAGIALLRYSFNSEYNFAVIRSQPCDPNILGLIADFLLQVDKIFTCVVFNETPDGVKLSVRSCVREVNAKDLTQFLTQGIGSGGGHFEKAGGFIAKKAYVQKYPSLHVEAYINNRMVEYFDSFDLVYTENFVADTSSMKMYMKNTLELGYVRMTEVLPEGTPITVRTLEGDMDLVVTPGLIIMIGIEGEVYPNNEEKFLRNNKPVDEPYVFEECVVGDDVYIPVIKNRLTGEHILITEYAHKCITTSAAKIYAKPLTRSTKVFVSWDEEKYMLGKPGDYFAVRSDDLSDAYIIEKNIFGLTYREI